jgi:hypothetical protein
MKTQHTDHGVSVCPGAASVREVLAYSNPDIVERIARDYGMTVEQAEPVFRDTIRFLYLAGATDARTLAPTKIIDKGWHSFLLFTRDYAEFCDRYFGHFIHHAPRRSSDPPPKVNHLAATFEVARQFFGPSLSSNWSYDIEAADCQKCTSQCSPDSGGGGSECTPDSGD